MTIFLRSLPFSFSPPPPFLSLSGTDLPLSMSIFGISSVVSSMRFKELGRRTKNRGTIERIDFKSGFRKPIHPIPGRKANTTSFSESCWRTVEVRILVNATYSPFFRKLAVYHYCRGWRETDDRCEAEPVIFVRSFLSLSLLASISPSAYPVPCVFFFSKLTKYRPS